VRPNAKLTLASTAFLVTMATGTIAFADVGINVSRKSPYGPYLTDLSGRSLYAFKNNQMSNSGCYGDCAKAWPPFFAQGKVEAGKGLDAANIGTVDRSDGNRQVTYHGRRLFYFSRDKKAGDTAGEGATGFGGEWYLVSPDGMMIRGK
jgi:predicted lipoprotein with Yx(FWY)xxD motif